MAAIRRKKKTDLGYHLVDKYTIIKRLEELNKFNEAISVLKSNELLYQKWLAVSKIRNDDQNARAMFTAIGLDPDSILAKE